MIAEKLKPKADWFEWLVTYSELCNQIEYLEFELKRAEIELKRWVEGDLQDVKLQEDSKGSRVEDNIRAYKRKIALKMQQRDELIQLVNTFEGLDHKILKHKYVDGMTLEGVADKLNYSHSHIRKRHAEIVKTVKFLRMYH